MTVGDRYPLTIFGRLLTCRTCGCDVDLIELPSPWIDGDAYQCGSCMRPAAVTFTFRCLTGPDTPVNVRPLKPEPRDMRDYDPATEPIPF